MSSEKSGPSELIELWRHAGATSGPSLPVRNLPIRESVGFCEGLGLAYTSASPHHVPIARLDAAQAAITN